MAEPEAGTVTTEQAVLLLMLDSAHQLKTLERDGAFRQIAKNRFWLKDLVQGYVKHLRELRNISDTATLATVMGVSAARVSQLARDGWFKEIKRGVWNWQDACNGYIRYLRDEDRRSTRSQGDSRIRDAKARDIEVRTLQRLSRLIPLEVYENMIDNFAGVVRTEFAGLATVCSRDLTMRRIIERQVNDRLRRIAEYAMAQAVRLEAVRGADDAVGSNGAGSVGGDEQDVSPNGGGSGS
jgi:transcriptional regulator with XRE-family HTH domain